MPDTRKGMTRRRLLLGFAPGLLREEDARSEVEEPEQPVELTQGLDALEKGEFQKAVDLLRPFTKEHKEHTEARAAMGLALYKLGQTVQAKVEFDRLVYAGRRDKLASLYQGLCLLKMGKTEKAAAAFRTYVNPDNDPVQDELYRQLGLMAEGAPAEDVIASVENATAKTA